MPYTPPLSTTTVVQCDQCQRYHDPQATTFFTVTGNISVGLTGGLIGNNLNEDTGVVERQSIFCHACLLLMLSDHAEETHREMPEFLVSLREKLAHVFA